MWLRVTPRSILQAKKNWYPKASWNMKLTLLSSFYLLCCQLYLPLISGYVEDESEGKKVVVEEKAKGIDPPVQIHEEVVGKSKELEKEEGNVLVGVKEEQGVDQNYNKVEVIG